MNNKEYFLLIGILILLISSNSGAVSPNAKIDRKAIVDRFSPSLSGIDLQAPFSVGNGGFTFTADVTGLQTFPEQYFNSGIPLETKARWAWHSRAATKTYTLADASKNYTAYGHQVAFPTNMDAAAGQWLRKNPHDLPLSQIGFTLDGSKLAEFPKTVSQQLQLWQGELHSQFALEDQTVNVTTFASQQSDTVFAEVHSNLLKNKRLAVDFRFPRGYDLAVKNTPAIDFGSADEHSTAQLASGKGYTLLSRQIDNATHIVSVSWQGEAIFKKIAAHHWRLSVANNQSRLVFAVNFSQLKPQNFAVNFAQEIQENREHWEGFWSSGGFVDVTASRDPRAIELQRRIILSRYLLAIQSRAAIPAQETGLTNSSWYGKHHTEMMWWHTAHWILWNQPEQAVRVLRWFKAHIPSAQAVAQERGLEGARWAKMVGPDNRESPGGNPLIIWNQPQPIHLAELLYQTTNNKQWLEEFAELVDETAKAMSAMLVWQEDEKRYSLLPPIWIAQEIYEPTETRNPTFELAYWRFALQIACSWRMRLGEPIPKLWIQVLNNLAKLPVKNQKYVAMEAIPDTFDKLESRKDHPSMLGAYGLLVDKSVDISTMRNTLDAVLKNWDWQEKIWGWDYPMIAMTAARLGRPQTAVDILLADLTHNHYLKNGHVPQGGSGLRVYLPANGALLSAVAMLVAGWSGAPDAPAPGFPNDGSWTVRAEGLSANL